MQEVGQRFFVPTRVLEAAIRSQASLSSLCTKWKRSITKTKDTTRTGRGSSLRNWLILEINTQCLAERILRCV
jgi:hypothetical protein